MCLSGAGGAPPTLPILDARALFSPEMELQSSSQSVLVSNVREVAMIEQSKHFGASRCLITQSRKTFLRIPQRREGEKKRCAEPRNA
jgi:hypothetical protein